MPTPFTRQQLNHQRGEIAFRSFHARGVDPGTLSYMQTCYRERRGIFRDLALSGVKISPFLDLGAETGPIALTLANDLDADGIALDLSHDALAAMPVYAKQMNLHRLPLRVRADAHALPLRNGCLPFAVTWGTLHHFPDPRPVLAELRRVLQPGGLLLIDGEPVKRRLSLNLGRTPSLYQMGWWTRLLLRLHLLPWLVTVDGREAEDAGAAEMQFSRKQYKQMFTEAFEQVMMRDSPYITALVRAAGPLGRLLLKPLGPTLAPKAEVSLFGGAVGARCWKQPERAALYLDATGAYDLASTPSTVPSTYLLHKKTSHRRLHIHFAQPLKKDESMNLSVDETVIAKFDVVAPNFIAFDLPADSYSRSSLILRLTGNENEIAHFVLSDTDGGDVTWITTNPPPTPATDALDALACPACWTVTARCRADLCGQPCAKFHGIRIEEAKAVIDGKLDPRAVAACPVGAIDHPPLVRKGDQFRCLVCETQYPAQNDILDLLTPATRNALEGGAE